MSPKALNVVCAVVFLASVSGCLRRSASLIQSEGASRPTLRREIAVPLGNCNQDGFDRELPVTNQYVQRLSRLIMGANPDVFRDDLAPERFCIGARLDNGGRAWAFSPIRRIIFDSSLIDRVQNDAQLAMVIGHELTHVTMRQTDLAKTIVPPPDRQEVEVLLAERNIVLSRIHGMGKPIPEARMAEYNRLQERDGNLLNLIATKTAAHIGADAAMNWEEVEADEVGSIFALRAGFADEELGWRTEQVAIAEASNSNPHGPPPAVSASERRGMAYASCGVPDPSRMRQPNRGDARYASPCWSLWNRLHGAWYRSQFFRQLVEDNRDMVDTEGEPTLADVKAEILRVSSRPEPVLEK